MTEPRFVWAPGESRVAYGLGPYNEQVCTSTQHTHMHTLVQARVMRKHSLASQRPTYLPQTRAPVHAHPPHTSTLGANSVEGPDPSA